MSTSVMSASYCPRLSEARNLLPLLRSHLLAAAPRHPLAVGVSLDLLPIVEDGLFGYELVPDPEPRFCLTIGCDAKGVPVLRKTTYRADARSSLRLAAVDGQAVARSASAMQRARQRDSRFPDWPSVVDAAWSELATLFPGRPRQRVELIETVHRYLDEALAVAQSELAAWDPYIRFCGLPNEAQQGFALHGPDGSHGELISQRPDMWILRWKSAGHAVYKEWSVMLPERDSATGLTRA